MTYYLLAECLYTGISSGLNAGYRVWEAYTFLSHKYLVFSVVFPVSSSLMAHEHNFSYLVVFQVNVGWFFSPTCFRRKPLRLSGTVILRPGCPSCQPTNSVKALKETKHQPQPSWAPIFSSSINGLVMEGPFQPLFQLSQKC